MTYSPKALYSCQMNNIPGPSTDIDPTTLTLNGDGECASSPYRFGSFIPASESMQAMNGVCTMMLYPQAECGGVATRVPMGSMQDETCVFRGGRSARLACAGSANEGLSCRSSLGLIFGGELTCCSRSLLPLFLLRQCFSSDRAGACSAGFNSFWSGLFLDVPFGFGGDFHG